MKAGIPRDILTARNLAKDMLMCDFESVMLCSRHNRRIVISLVLAYILYLLVATVMGFVGLKGIAGIMWYLIPFVALWLAYGLSPLCLPMIPTCMLSDIIESVQVVLPAKITWPDALQVYAGCLGPKWYDPNATVVAPIQFANITRGQSTLLYLGIFSNLYLTLLYLAGSSECMLSCRGPPFYFLTWQSSLAWVACTLNPTTCSSLQIPYCPDFSQHTRNYSTVIDFGDVDLNAAYTFCFWGTIAQAVPYLLLAIGLILLVIVMAQVPFQMAAASIQCIIQALVYSHVQVSD
jgi:hypothetical protein